MHLPELISDLAVILLTGGIVTVIFKKLNQPLVLGYILAGFLIGPYMPFFFNVTDSASISTWSEIGIIILMFGLGLEFNLHKLVSVGGTAIITALTEVGGMLLFGYLVGQALGWGTMDSVFLGGMLSMSSTTIIIKAFDELGVRNQGFAQLVFGTLVIEDIAGIFMMIILSTISVGQGISGMALALKLGMLVLYLALWLILGIYLLPTLLNEGVLLLAFGYRSRRSWLVFLLVNLVTQGGFALYLAVTVLNHGVSGWSLLFYLPIELIITVVESLLYRRLLTERSWERAVGYAIVANVCSATVGLLLIDPLWRFIVSIS